MFESQENFKVNKEIMGLPVDSHPCKHDREE